MRKIIFIIAIVMSGHAFAEDVTSQFTKCAVTDNDKDRLACYDKIRDDLVKANTQTPKAKDGYQDLDLSDLKVDIKSLKGKKVSVAAYIQTVGTISMLKENGEDMTPIIASTDSLPREDRKKITSECAPLCMGHFFGVVKTSVYGDTLSIQKVDWAN